MREKTDGTVEIYGEINGLDDGEHGIHIHEFGGLGNNCVDAGGHFDPAMVSSDTLTLLILHVNSRNDSKIILRQRKATMDFMLEI